MCILIFLVPQEETDKETGRSSDMSLLEQMLSNFGSSILSIQTAQQVCSSGYTDREE